MEIKYCAFLRGVNVKGTNMKMAEVVSVFKSADMNNVNSILASGNIVFSCDNPKEKLRGELEKAMSEHFDYEAFLFLKSQEEIRQMIDYNPFISDENLHIYVFICENGFENTLMEEFNKCSKTENESAKITNNIFYWQIQKGSTLDGEFSKILGKKQFKDKFTSRNINTIEKIYARLK